VSGDPPVTGGDVRPRASRPWRWSYVAGLLILGAVGVVAPGPELALFYGVDLSGLPAVERTVVLHQLSLLKVFVLGVALWSIAFRHEIFTRRLHRGIFLTIMFGEVASRLLSIVRDGYPGSRLVSITATALVLALGFAVATRESG
jgi:hypothetical protein